MSIQTTAPMPGVKICMFCGTTHDRLTCEHVIPNSARRSFGIKGSVTVDIREDGLDQRRRVGSMQALNVTLDDAICDDCNNIWLSRLEREVKPLPLRSAARRDVLTREGGGFHGLTSRRELSG
jgi:hypothetical protein